MAAPSGPEAELGEMTPLEAGQELADFLITLKQIGRLSAKDVCVLCHYATIAGLTGPATEFSFRLDAPTGHYNRHLNTVLKLNEAMSGSYTVSVPGQDKYELGRVSIPMPCFLPHECLSEEIDNTPEMVDKLRASRANNEWPDAFVEHPVSRDAPPGADVWPLCLYVDGIPLHRRDGVLAFYAYNMISETRHLLFALRRSQLCNCGCLGWCSLHQVWTVLMWSFACLARGQWPSRRHDFNAFGAGDEERQQKSGRPLMRGALVHVKGDWSEFVHTVGMMSWQTILHPCYRCWASLDELAVYEGFSLVASAHELKTAADYDRACAACEVRVRVLDPEAKAILVGALFYDTRNNGAHGRALRVDVPQLGLLKGDRLEPSFSLADVSKLETLGLPCDLLFWRPRSETLSKHRCPLFAVPGVSLKTLAPDTLHTLHLGCFKAFCQTTLWLLVDTNAFQVNATTAESRLELSVMSLRHELFAWYSEHRGQRQLYELTDLTPPMLGTSAHPHLSTKAAETGTLAEFCVDLLKQRGGRLGGQGAALLALGEALLELRRLCRECPRRLAVAQADALAGVAKRAAMLREPAGVPFTPKWHLMLHLACDSLWRGNPQTYGTFMDENLNGFLGKLAAHCHRTTWYKSVLGNFRMAITRGHAGRRRQRGE